MRKGLKVQIGVRLLFAGAFLLMGNFIMAGVCATFPGWNYVPGILATGLTDEEVAPLLVKIKSQTEDFLTKNGFTKKADIDAIIDAKLKSYEGMEPEALKALLKADTGVMAILKKQGEEITSLKEKASSGEIKKKDLKTVFFENMDKIKAVFEKGEGSHTISLKAAAVMTTANTVDYDALPDDVIDSFSLAGFVAKRYPREYVFDIANVSTVAEVEKYIVWEEEGDTEGAYAEVAEGGLKPLMSSAIVKNVSTARKVAAKHVVTEEFVKWRAKAYTIIKRLISQKVTRDYAAILTTDLLADAVAYSGSILDGQYTVPTDYHAIGAVAAQIEALDFMPDLLILNPQDKWRIGLQQGTDGHFYLAIPGADPRTGTKIMGFTVRTSNRMPAGYFMLGESGLWEIVQESIKIRTGYGITVTGGTSNGGGNVTDVQGDLDHNRFRVIVEQFFHNYLATPNIGSFVYANFNTVKAALEAPGS